MNLYATLDNVKSYLGIVAAATDDDDILMIYLELASREVDALCHRHFYAETATHYFDTGPNNDSLLIDDVLSIDTLQTDSELDGTLDGESWTEGATNDYVLWPWNNWPKMQVQLSVNGDFSFPANARRYVVIDGLFGYGNGKSATPYEASGVNVTADDATEVQLDVSADDIIEPGHTILVEAEQIYVSSVEAGFINVERAVNGTTGAAHAAKAASIYVYPKLIMQAVKIAAGDTFTNMGTEGFSSERIGDYSYNKLTNRGDSMVRMALSRYVGPYVKVVIA